MHSEIDEYLEYERQEKEAQLLLNSAQAHVVHDQEPSLVNADANLASIFDTLDSRHNVYDDKAGSFLGEHNSLNLKDDKGSEDKEKDTDSELPADKLVSHDNALWVVGITAAVTLLVLLIIYRCAIKPRRERTANFRSLKSLDSSKRESIVE